MAATRRPARRQEQPARDLPWVTAPLDLSPGDVVRTGSGEYTVAEPVRAGTVLGVDPTDGRLRPLPATGRGRG